MFVSPGRFVMTSRRIHAGVAGAAMTLDPGFKLDHYLVHHLIHTDGMEESYRARDTRIDRDVVLHLARSPMGSGHFARFLQKWKTGAVFCHPNVLAVYDFGWHEGRPFMVSELLEGETLRALMDAGPLAPATAAGLAMQIADGLDAAHRASVVHGDLRPENVFVTPRGDVKILNFSPGRYTGEVLELVQQDSRAVAARGIRVTAVSYLSPEQVTASTVDLRTDIFSVGVMLYEMVTGVAPFSRSSPIATLRAIAEDDLPELDTDDPAVLDTVNRVVRRCVEKDPAERFQTALGLLFKLELLLPSLRASEPRDRFTTPDEMMGRVRGLFGPRELR